MVFYTKFNIAVKGVTMFLKIAQTDQSPQKPQGMNIESSQEQEKYGIFPQPAVEKHGQIASPAVEYQASR